MADTKFGTCCALLEQAMSPDDGVQPLISVDESGVLMIGVGLVELEDDEQGTFEHPLFFCPFCGTKLQSQEEVEAKVGADSDAES
jgi:hypothetical protein